MGIIANGNIAFLGKRYTLLEKSKGKHHFYFAEESKIMLNNCYRLSLAEIFSVVSTLLTAGYLFKLTRFLPVNLCEISLKDIQQKTMMYTLKLRLRENNLV